MYLVIIEHAHTCIYEKRHFLFLEKYIFIRIIIMGLWQISHGKSSPIVTNLNSYWWWLTVGSKSVAAIGPIPYIDIAKMNQSILQNA